MVGLVTHVYLLLELFLKQISQFLKYQRSNMSNDEKGSCLFLQRWIQIYFLIRSRCLQAFSGIQQSHNLAFCGSMLHLFLGCEFHTFFSTQKAHKVRARFEEKKLLTSILEPTSVYYSLEGRLYYLGGGRGGGGSPKTCPLHSLPSNS